MVKQIPENVIEEIRLSTDIVDVISEYVSLKKQGRNYFGLCPFHQENTPSFSVTQDKQIFHCFGCKKGGNVFTFLMELEGYSFTDVLAILAKRNGITLPNITTGKHTSNDNQSAIAAYEWLTKLYHHLLKHTPEGKEGYHYLKDRGIDDDTIEQFQLGYAPNVKDFTLEFLEKKGYHRQFLVKAGILTLQDDNNVTDRFRGRVVFPIRNHIGKTIAFSGRSLLGQNPKYLNSSESPIFHKGRILFNFDLAKKHIRRQHEVILFEGQMDVITAYQEGIRNVVATLGTTITESQAKLLNRYAETVIICYDADHAGVEASYKAASLLRSIGCKVKISQLKNNLDPDTFIKEHGADAFMDQIIKASDTFITFYMRYLKKDFNLSIEGDRLQYIKSVLKLLATMNSSVEQEYYLKDISNEFHLSMDTLKKELSTLQQDNKHQKDKYNKNRYNSKTREIHSNNKLLPAFHNAERHLIAHMLNDQHISHRVQKEIGINFNVEAHKIITTHLYAFYEEYLESNISKFIETIPEDSLKELVTEIAMIPIQLEISNQEIDDYLRVIHNHSNNITSINEYRQQQKIAEQENDPIKAAEIAMRIIELQKNLKHSK